MNWSHIFDGLAVLATLLGGWAAWRATKIDRHLLDIEEAREADRRTAAATADVHVQLVEPPGKKRKDLIVQNDGPAAAGHVDVKMKMAEQVEDAFHSPGEGDLRNEGVPEPPFDLDAGAKQVWWLATSNKFHPPFHIQLTWTDGRGRQQRRTTVSA